MAPNRHLQDMLLAYSLEEYASVVVMAVRMSCDQKGVAHPVLCSESGRALVSHHSLLIFDVLSLQQKAVSAGVGLDLDLETLPDELLGECKSMETYARLGDFQRSLASRGSPESKRRRFVQGGKARPGTDDHGRRSMRRRCTLQQAGGPTLLLSVRHRLHPQIRDSPSRRWITPTGTGDLCNVGKNVLGDE
ncbi:hypothetical protein KI387_021351, partial [Taxus chinensis]